MSTLQDRIDRINDSNYQCVAGYLRNDADYQELVEIAKAAVAACEGADVRMRYLYATVMAPMIRDIVAKGQEPAP